MPNLDPVLDQLIDQLIEDNIHISDSRQTVLHALSDYIRKNRKSGNLVRLHFICTHNSRRSQMAQIWTFTAAVAYQLPEVTSFSGGTEATEFHPNAIRAMRTLGFRIHLAEHQPEPDNPRYEVAIGDGLPTLTCYSKKFEDAIPPDSEFAAIMTCSEADQNCPLVPGSKVRIPLTFEDPKRYDGSNLEQNEYLKTAIEIGREVITVFHNL